MSPLYLVKVKRRIRAARALWLLTELKMLPPEVYR